MPWSRQDVEPRGRYEGPVVLWCPSRGSNLGMLARGLMACMAPD